MGAYASCCNNNSTDNKSDLAVDQSDKNAPKGQNPI